MAHRTVIALSAVGKPTTMGMSSRSTTGKRARAKSVLMFGDKQRQNTITLTTTWRRGFSARYWLTRYDRDERNFWENVRIDMSAENNEIRGRN